MHKQATSLLPSFASFWMKLRHWFPICRSPVMQPGRNLSPDKQQHPLLGLFASGHVYMCKLTRIATVKRWSAIASWEWVPTWVRRWVKRSLLCSGYASQFPCVNQVWRVLGPHVADGISCQLVSQHMWWFSGYPGLSVMLVSSACNVRDSCLCLAGWQLPDTTSLPDTPALSSGLYQPWLCLAS